MPHAKRPVSSPEHQRSVCIRVIEKTLDKGESKLEKSLYQKLRYTETLPCADNFLTRTSAHWSIGPNRSSRCSAVQCNAEYVNIYLGESVRHMLYAVTDHYLYTYLFTYPSLDYFFLDGVEVCSTRVSLARISYHQINKISIKSSCLQIASLPTSYLLQA